MATTFPLPTRLSGGTTLRWTKRAAWAAGVFLLLLLLRLTVF